jgi:FkbM family methyltransferase
MNPSQLLFWLCAHVGRPFGGVRPRRIVHRLAKRAFTQPPKPDEFRWYTDCYGLKFRLHPYYLLDYQVIAFGTYDPWLGEMIERQVHPGMWCLDVGANLGLMGLHLAKRVGPTGRVHAFEPVPHLQARLRENVAANGFGDRVAVHGEALSDRTGSMTLTLADPHAANQGTATLTGDAQSGTKVEVATLTLDDFAARTALTRLDLIKVDIQGAEPLFLAGGAATLRRFRPKLLMEVQPEDLAGLGKTSRDLLRQLEDLGYRVHELERRGRIGRRVHADSVPENYSRDAVWCE